MSESPIDNSAARDSGGLLRAHHQRASRRKWSEKYPGRIGLTLLVLTALHVPFWFVVEKHPVADNVNEPPAPRIVVLPKASEDSAGGTSSASDLFTWLNIDSPTQWLYPNWVEGFSKYNVSLHDVLFPRTPRLPARPNPLQKLPFSEVASFTARVVPDETMIRRIATPLPRRIAPAPAQHPPVHGIYWRRIDTGEILTAPPKLSAAALVLWATPEAHDAIRQPTRIEISGLPGFSAPRVLIRTRCGVPALDAAAQDAVRAVLTKHMITGDAFVSPVFLEVDWSY